jgi:hypothetical protein
MKSILIFLLTMALGASAVLTRPSPAACEAFLKQQHENETMAEKIGDFFGRHKYVVKDNYLWVDISKDGKPVYTGAFGHFFKRDGEAGK